MVFIAHIWYYIEKRRIISVVALRLLRSAGNTTLFYMFTSFSIKLDEQTLLQALKELLPTLTVELYDEIIEQDSSTWPEVAFQVVPNKSNFPTYVNFNWFLGVAPEEIFIELARRLSLYFKCSTVCDPGQFKPQDSQDSPYWDIVWNQGQAFLGDDVDWEGYLGEGGHINIFHPIEVPTGDLEEMIVRWKERGQQNSTS